MADRPRPIPVRQTTLATFAWAFHVSERHWRILLATMVACGTAGFVPWIGGIAQSVAVIPLVVLAHNEVICGPAQFGPDTLGHRGKRALLYFADAFMISLVCGIIIAVPSALLLAAMLQLTMISNTVSYSVLAISGIVGIVVSAGLFLRLPSRAIGNTLSWLQTWQLGKDQTVGLVVVGVLTAIPALIVSGGQIYLLMDAPVTSAVAQGILTPFFTVITTCYLSLMYIHCLLALDPRRNNPQGGQT